MSNPFADQLVLKGVQVTLYARHVQDVPIRGVIPVVLSRQIHVAHKRGNFVSERTNKTHDRQNGGRDVVLQ